MRLLILGGTRFVGRHVVEAALAEGHAVTLFNRGKSGAGLFPGVERRAGERGGDHAALAGGEWDAVIDVTGYRPKEVRSAMDRLRGRAGVYVFVSTASVYARFEQGGSESAALHEPVEDTPDGKLGAFYGPLKRACELAVEREWGGPWSVARPCVVAGPHDHTDRFTYWPVRAARGGDVLAPGSPEAFAQIVDARDLAAWLLRAAKGEAGGTFNLVGDPVAFRVLVSGAGARPVFADDAFLLARGVKPFEDLPLWLPAPARPFDNAKAKAAGFRPRPTAETAAATLAWRRQDPKPLVAGLPPEREAALVAELKAVK